MDAQEPSENISRARQALQERRWTDAEALARTELSLAPQSAFALRVLTEALSSQNRLSEAIVVAEQLDALEPNDPRLLGFLSRLCWQTGQIPAAHGYSKRLVELSPMNAGAHNGLAMCCVALQDWTGAAEEFRTATHLKPDSPDLHHNLASAYEQLGRNEEAVSHYREALRLRPELIGSAYNLANLVVSQANAESSLDVFKRTESDALSVEEKMAQAEELISRVLALDPKHAEAHLLRAAILQERGQHVDAIADLRSALGLNPSLIGAYWRLTRSKKITPDDQPVVENMMELSLDATQSNADRILLHNGLGKALDDLGDHGGALAQYDQAHAIAQIDSPPFDRRGFSNRLDALIAMFSPSFFVTHRAIGTDSSLPVFIVGMPRSSTTLTEQILSSHSQVTGGGEIPYWPEQADRVVHLAERKLDAEEANRLASLYLRALAQIGPGSLRVVDKNPYNSEHVGLLHALYPNARFVYCRRHPIDNCLSMYMANFRFPPRYVHDRADLVYAYREYERLFGHWRSVIPADRFMEVRYEDLVSDREAMTAKLIAFCGLDWEESCLHPEKNDRIVLTASQWQVRQPVYKTSLERWKKYAGHLGAFLDLQDSP